MKISEGKTNSVAGHHWYQNNLQWTSRACVGKDQTRTVASVAKIDTGLQRLYANLEKIVYKHTHLLSCRTLDVENCHSTVHVKQANMSKAEYCRSFGLAM